MAIPKNETGCEESSFEGFPRGHIALVKRGICYFSTKTDLAIAAGSSFFFSFSFLKSVNRKK